MDRPNTLMLGKHRRLVFAISKLEMIDNPYDSEKEALATARMELKSLETAMRASGLEP